MPRNSSLKFLNCLWLQLVNPPSYRVNPKLLSLLALSLIFALGSCAVTSEYRVPLRTDSFGLQFVPASVNGVDGVFLVDSGASHTVLDQKFAQRCVRNFGPSNLRLAWLGSRNAQTMSGQVDEIIIGNYRKEGPIRLHILNLDAINQAPSRQTGQRIDGILGSDFLIGHRASINYQSRELGFQSNGTAWE